MTDDLVAWLRAQLDEDERVANGVGRTSELHWGQGMVWSASQALREVAAKRAIVDAWQKHEDELRDLDSAQEYGFRQGLEFALQNLASAYADRPGYRAEWKPDEEASCG